MNGEYVGVWFWTRGGVPVLRYDDTWLRSPQVRPLSLSLPIPAGDKELRGPAVEHYFDNLLPDSARIRERLRRRFRVAGDNAAELLAAIGRDCVGALQLVPAGEAPPPFDRIDSKALTEAQVAHALRQVTVDTPDGDAQDDLRISIAGAQEKTALLRIGRRWHRPLGATPTTHILKLPLGLIGNLRADMRHSIENEWLCAQVLDAWGLAAARCEIGRFDDQKALVVERFDRRWAPDRGWIARLPQEDFCQATGTAAERKYESDGGPGLRQCLALLAGSEAQQADRLPALAATRCTNGRGQRVRAHGGAGGASARSAGCPRHAGAAAGLSAAGVGHRASRGPRAMPAFRSPPFLKIRRRSARG